MRTNNAAERRDYLALDHDDAARARGVAAAQRAEGSRPCRCSLNFRSVYVLYHTERSKHTLSDRSAFSNSSKDPVAKLHLKYINYLHPTVDVDVEDVLEEPLAEYVYGFYPPRRLEPARHTSVYLMLLVLLVGYWLVLFAQFIIFFMPYLLFLSFFAF